MMEDFDIPLRRAPVAKTPIASGGGIYAKIYRHSRSDFEAPSIDNHASQRRKLCCCFRTSRRPEMALS
jgi:hypothetical protein